MTILASLLVLQYFVYTLTLASAVTDLRADGVTDTYTLIKTAYGEDPIVLQPPDCNHSSFGPHITQIFDSALQRHVFAFHLHIKSDDDMCKVFDRQRNEISTYDNPPFNLVGYYGDRVTLSWNFKLDAGFLPPYSFCHIHQLKAKGGDDGMPLITITTRKSNPNELQLVHYDSKGALNFLTSVPLAPFVGTWIHAFTDISYGSNGQYEIHLTRLSDGLSLLSYKNDDIDLWRNETNFAKPKWGIYRSLQESALSRDETILFDSICVGKKGDCDICT